MSDKKREVPDDEALLDLLQRTDLGLEGTSFEDYFGGERIKQLELEVAAYRSALEAITEVPACEIRGQGIGRYGILNGHKKAVEIAQQALEGKV